ncbi:MAG: hypothetical protein J3Q66DRAFT_399271 [Benniella sp.]|nr:MAG: hypothetical protein J3Q66DRAFT_399271 [Benniella sp.]
MNASHPLRILEAVRYIAQYMDPAASLRVCRVWRDMFRPYLWRSITLLAETPLPTNRSLDVALAHHTLIQDLTVVGRQNNMPGIYLPNLLQLTLNDIFTPARPPPSIRFHESFTSLTTLVLDGVAPAQRTWELLPNLHSLSKLVMTSGEVRAGDAALFWGACGRLQFLSLTRVHIQGGPIPEVVSFHGMQHAAFFGISRTDAGFDGNVQLDMVLRCPRLQTVDWESPSVFNVTTPVRQGNWPYLETLFLLLRLRDQDLVRVLERSSVAGGLRRLMLRHAHLGVHSARQLAFHSPTLVEADLEHCVSLISTAVRDMLCTCHNLRSLRTRTVLARDIALGGPWVCQQLQELTIWIRFHDDEVQYQPVVFHRLSTLIHLRELKLKIPENDQYHQTGMLDFRMAHGVDQLASLQQLETLCFESSPQEVCVQWQEATWLVQTLPLRYLFGDLNPDVDVDVDRVFKTFLRDQGIMTSWYALEELFGHTVTPKPPCPSIN